MTELIDTAREVDERTVRDIIDAVTCSVSGCTKTARWVTRHTCGNVIYACHAHRKEQDRHEAWHAQRNEQCPEMPLCAQCAEMWRMPWTWDRI